jgi:hypothetical protein
MLFLADLGASCFLFIHSQFQPNSKKGWVDTWPLDLLGMGAWVPFVGARIYGLRFNLHNRLAKVITASVAFPAIVVLVVASLRQILSVRSASVCFAALFMAVFGLILRGMQQESSARNPLFGVIKDVEKAVAARGDDISNDQAASLAQSTGAL